MAEESAGERRLAQVEQATRQDRFRGLVEIMRILRGPDGCPWDRKQDLRSLRRYVLEEAYEVVQAIDDGDVRALPGELGDLLLQIVFLSQMAAEEGHFDVDDVIEVISDKLIRRHPHVFGETSVEGSHEVVQRWEMLKLQERGGGSVLDDMPASLPALARAEKLGRRAAQLGFDWEGPAAVLEKVEEEIGELRAVLGDRRAEGGGEEEEVGDRVTERPEPGEIDDPVADAERVEEEIGDLLFALSSLARHLGISPEVALRRAGEKFERRFRAIEPRVPDGSAASPEELDDLWEEEKARERHRTEEGKARERQQTEEGKE